MAGTRVTHGASVNGQVSVQLAGAWRFVRVINWGTGTIMAVAKQGTASPPTLAWKDDDIDVCPVGQSTLIAVSGDIYDQGQPGEDASRITVVYVVAQAVSDFSVVGANG